jgi:signal transduction histidine kinase
MKLSTKLYIGFSLVITLSLVDSYIDFALAKTVVKNTEFLINSEAVIRNSSQLHKFMIEMQSSFRGYLLTNNENFLESYYKGMKEIPALLQEEEHLLAENTIQKQKLDTIRIFYNQWIDYADALILAKKKSERGENAEYQSLFSDKLQKEVGKKINDMIKIKFLEFDKYEYQVRQKRRLLLEESLDNARNASVILAIFIVIIGVISALYITRLITKRIATMVELAQKISLGEFKIMKDESSDELTNLSASLNSMSKTLDKNFTELDKKNKELNQFGYVVSHDLKAPLRGIYNIIIWIEEDLSHEMSAQLKIYIEMMKGRIHRLENLINGLLDYARIGREVQNVEMVFVKDLIKEIADELVPKNMTIQIIDPLPIFQTSRLKLHQVFSNLISNAVKHGDKTDLLIVVSCLEEHEYYKFSVKDNGVGVLPEYHEKIFVIFQTLREKNEIESTGIGLAIVKKIIEDEKGQIMINSTEGNGAEFVFTWPRISNH